MDISSVKSVMFLHKMHHLIADSVYLPYGAPVPPLGNSVSLKEYMGQALLLCLINSEAFGLDTMNAERGENRVSLEEFTLFPHSRSSAGSQSGFSLSYKIECNLPKKYLLGKQIVPLTSRPITHSYIKKVLFENLRNCAFYEWYDLDNTHDFFLMSFPATELDLVPWGGLACLPIRVACKHSPLRLQYSMHSRLPSPYKSIRRFHNYTLVRWVRECLSSGVASTGPLSSYAFMSLPDNIEMSIEHDLPIFLASTDSEWGSEVRDCLMLCPKGDSSPLYPARAFFNLRVSGYINGKLGDFSSAEFLQLIYLHHDIIRGYSDTEDSARGSYYEHH